MTAAQNIINIYNARDANEPQWWVEQAFVVTAGICNLCLASSLAEFLSAYPTVRLKRV